MTLLRGCGAMCWAGCVCSSRPLQPGAAVAQHHGEKVGLRLGRPDPAGAGCRAGIGGVRGVTSGAEISVTSPGEAAGGRHPLLSLINPTQIGLGIDSLTVPNLQIDSLTYGRCDIVIFSLLSECRNPFVEPKVPTLHPLTQICFSQWCQRPGAASGNDLPGI